MLLSAAGLVYFCLTDQADKPQPFYSLLHGAELHPDNELRLRRHVLEDVSLQPPEHVRAQQVMELFNLVLLGDVGKLLQEALQVAVQIRKRNQPMALLEIKLIFDLDPRHFSATARAARLSGLAKGNVFDVFGGANSLETFWG